MLQQKGGPATHLSAFLLLRPGRPPPKGLLSAKSMCFWLSTRTMKEGTFTICLPTLSLRIHAQCPADVETSWRGVLQKMARGDTKDTCANGQLHPEYCAAALPTKSATSYNPTPIASSLIGAMPEALEMYLHNKTTPRNPDGCFKHDYIARC